MFDVSKQKFLMLLFMVESNLKEMSNLRSLTSIAGQQLLNPVVGSVAIGINLLHGGTRLSSSAATRDSRSNRLIIRIEKEIEVRVICFETLRLENQLFKKPASMS
jgi:hypothetical protein